MTTAVALPDKPDPITVTATVTDELEVLNIAVSDNKRWITPHERMATGDFACQPPNSAEPRRIPRISAVVMSSDRCGPADPAVGAGFVAGERGGDRDVAKLGDAQPAPMIANIYLS
jgi:hypothetical protein